MKEVLNTTELGLAAIVDLLRAMESPKIHPSLFAEKVDQWDRDFTRNPKVPEHLRRALMLCLNVLFRVVVREGNRQRRLPLRHGDGRSK
ncbi:MAG: hypothetical protein ACRDHG_06225 [Anaerolineales bacterium]